MKTSIVNVVKGQIIVITYEVGASVVAAALYNYFGEHNIYAEKVWIANHVFYTFAIKTDKGIAEVRRIIKTPSFGV